MKKRLKGFTLVECVIAMAILGISSLTLVQIYATVARMNITTHVNNTSLAMQMQYVEKYIDGETHVIDVSSTGVASANNGDTADVAASDAYTVLFTSDLDGTVYAYPVHVFVLQTRDGEDNVRPDDAADRPDLKYQYFQGAKDPYSP